MTKIPPDEILEGLYKLRTRESEKLKTVLELYDLEIHQKKKEVSSKIYGIGMLAPETEIMKETPWSRKRGQRIFGDCWQWEANGQCSNGDNCSFRHDTDKRGKIDTAESVSEFFHAVE